MRYADTPIDYSIATGMVGRVDIAVHDDETCADLTISDAAAEVLLRLDRKELAALIASAAAAMAVLD